MGRWTDIATWVGPITNSGDGDGVELEPADRMSGHVGVVIHTAEGSFDGTISWQRNPAAQVGSHFITAKDGRVVQMIDTDDRSWCQSAGNSTWISIEDEGRGSLREALTPSQVENCARILARAHQTYGVPLQVSNSPNTPGLGWHGMGGAAWGGHYDCPGEAIKAQLPAIVARASEIVNGPQKPTEPELQYADILHRGSDASSLDNMLWTLYDFARKGGTPAPVTLNDAQLATLADLVTARLAAQSWRVSKG